MVTPINAIFSRNLIKEEGVENDYFSSNDSEEDSNDLRKKNRKKKKKFNIKFRTSKCRYFS